MIDCKSLKGVNKTRKSGIKWDYDLNYLNMYYDFSNETLHDYSTIYDYSNGVVYSNKDGEFAFSIVWKKFFFHNHLCLFEFKVNDDAKSDTTKN